MKLGCEIASLTDEKSGPIKNFCQIIYLTLIAVQTQPAECVQTGIPQEVFLLF
jgi:hypothetical protein